MRSFLTPAEEAVYGRFTGPPEQAVLERFFFLDDADRDLVVVKRGDHNRLGFSLQLVTVRHLGRFLEDPLDVPSVVVDYVASQIGVADPSCVKAYLERKPTRFEHQAEICEVYGYRRYAAVKESLLAWVGDQSWATGDGPKALFYSAVARLRAERVLLPGVTTLRDDVAGARKAAESRLYVALADAITAEQADELQEILKVPEGKHRSQLELWRRGPKNPTGRGLVRSLERVAEIAGLHMGAVDVAGTGVPTRRVIELARAGFEAKAPKLAALKYHRKIATLLATVRWLEVTATDDALELLDVFMSAELIGRAGRSSDKETLKRAPGQARHAGVLSAAVQVLFEAETWGDAVPLAVVWDAIESTVGSRAKLRTAMESVQELIPPKDAEPDGQWRAQVVERFNTVRGFVRLLCQVISFGATAEAVRVVNAMRELPALIDAKESVRVPKGWLDARKVDIGLVPRGWWNRLVFPKDRPEGCVDRNAYVFCVLELFHTGLKRRDVFARTSDRFADPRARLLADDAWDAVKGRVLSALLLPEDPAGLLATHTVELDEAWQATVAGLDGNASLSVDASGRLHLGKDPALEDPPSLVDLRKRLEGMIPRVDLSELILEVMSWHPDLVAAFTSVTGGRARLADLSVSVAALLTAHALNVGLSPVVDEQIAALTRGRLVHVDQHYLRSETYAAANAVLIDAQAGIGLAQAWGGGLVAAVDGVRFVVPVRSIDARRNPKYFARKKGVTWLNMISDQRIGLAGRVVSGAAKDTLHFVDLVFNPDSDRRPEVLITDQGSYSDIVFGIVTLLGFDYRPVLADLPDTKLWRINSGADYALLNKAARGQISLDKISQHWPDILRVICSIHTRTVSAHDVIRMLQRDGRPTQLGEAFGMYGRIFKTRHVLTLVDDPAYRREMKGMRNLNEGRHDLGRHLFHGRKGELHRAYRDGQEDQLGALGLVLNCVTLWNTVYLDRALTELRAQGYPVLEEDVARLSAYTRRHINVHGHYSFRLPDLAGAWRSLRDPDQSDPDEQD
ncbi:transposase [Actinoplanes capillaceus]|uniref:Transposase n=1 Tax=Actinoplanes campanulatus TaxID=113559 RepID=A0ABQ3WQ53_9ACTN|nr:Tn3 family transposase [Actinoplanes capillaceus]GID48333.1 transposase [Actinoplanes capillaceus]